MFSNPRTTHPPGELLNRLMGPHPAFPILGLGCSLRVCIPNKFPGEDTAGPGSTFCKALL